MMYLGSQYVSAELFHFVGRHQPNQEAQFNLLVSILKSGLLQSSECDPSADVATGSRLLGGELTNVPAICFCDIPRTSLDIHIKKYGAFGLSFAKSFLSERGARPVFYIPLRSTVSQGQGNRGQAFPKHLRTLLSTLTQLRDAKGQANWTKKIGDSEMRKLAATAANQSGFLTNEVYHFIKVFDDELPADHEKNYYMEREWRIIENPKQTLLHFSLADVNAVTVPWSFQSKAWQQLPGLSNRLVTLQGAY